MKIGFPLSDSYQDAFVRYAMIGEKHGMWLILRHKHPIISLIKIRLMAVHLDIGENRQKRKRYTGQSRNHLSGQTETENGLPPCSLLIFPFKLRSQSGIEKRGRFQWRDHLRDPIGETQNSVFTGAGRAFGQMAVQSCVFELRQLIIDLAEQQIAHCSAFHTTPSLHGCIYLRQCYRDISFLHIYTGDQ
jgi:hypothetical protein